MVFPVVGGNESKGYEISNSLRFDKGDSPYLSFALSTPTNDKIYTWSYWIKRGNISFGNTTIFGHGTNDGNAPFIHHAFEADDELRFDSYDNETTSVASVKPSMLFRDPSAWYHIVYAFDTTQSTASNRLKIYVNGNQITDFASSTYPAQDKVLAVNKSGVNFVIGEYDTYGSTYLDAYLSEINFVDGQQLSPTSFGEFDDNGVWIPIKYTGTYGNNGFFLEFKQTGTSANSSGIGADTSGNDNHFSVSNLAATDVTEDTCTNNFATCNVLSGKNTSDLTTGNLVLDADSTGDIIAPSTIGFSSGKWYMEMKSTITAGHGNRKTVGVYETDNNINYPRAFSSSFAYSGVVVDLRNGSAYESADDDDATDISSFANNDICGLAYDADNGLLYVYKNGTAENSGNAINAGNALDTSKTYAFYIGQDGGGTNNGELFCNFGNPSFAISSGNNDGKYGNFEYAPPSGYYALCTKRLAEFG